MVSIEKTGIMSASGEINENLLIGSGGSNAATLYVEGATGNVRSKITNTLVDGELHITQAATTAEKYFRFMPPTASKMWGLKPGSTYTLSFGIKGTTAGYISVRSQWQITGGWTGGSAIRVLEGDSTEYKFISVTETIPSDATAYYISIQNYDSTAGTDYYIKGLKFEESDHPTPWVPNELDNIYTGNINGFVETADLSRISEEYIEGNNFYEY